MAQKTTLAQQLTVFPWRKISMICYLEYLKIATKVATKYEEITSSSHEVLFT